MISAKELLLASACAHLSAGFNIDKPKKGFKIFVDNETDLRVKLNKPVNGYQVKQRKRKARRRGE